MARSLPLAAGKTIMILSPHLDDAVLSCGALMMDAHRRHAGVVMVTVFNGRSAWPVSEAATRFHARCGHTDYNAMDEREKEDNRALEVVHARTERLQLPEALYRKHTDGTYMYQEDSAIFVSDIPAFDDAFRDVVHRIAEQIDAVQPDMVLAPVGIGGHVDHLLVSAAAERLDCAVFHYEDVPYVIYERCRDWRRASAARTAHLHYCSDEAWQAKNSAIECYRSQRSVLWYSPGTWREDLEAYAVTAGNGQRAERLWSFDGR